MAPTPRIVIPAKAGIQGRGGVLRRCFPAQPHLDSRFRGNDGGERGNDGGERGNDGGERGNDGGERGNDGGERGNDGGERGNDGGERGNDGGERGNDGGERGNDGGERGNDGGERGNDGEGRGNDLSRYGAVLSINDEFGVQADTWPPAASLSGAAVSAPAPARASPGSRISPRQGAAARPPRRWPRPPAGRWRRLRRYP